MTSLASPSAAFSALVGRRQLRVDRRSSLDKLTSKLVPTFAYEFNDDAAPTRFPPARTRRWPRTGPSSPTCSTCRTALIQEPFGPEQEQLAGTMRAAWAELRRNGKPLVGSTAVAVVQARAASDVARGTKPRVDTEFASRHHVSFWSGAEAPRRRTRVHKEARHRRSAGAWPRHVACPSEDRVPRPATRPAGLHGRDQGPESRPSRHEHHNHPPESGTALSTVSESEAPTAPPWTRTVATCRTTLALTTWPPTPVTGWPSPCATSAGIRRGARPS